MPYPLINLKTDLKSLKYGHDQPGGGSSKEPYIQNNIDNPKDILGFDDGLVRGGALGAVRASLNDTVRIGKWLKDLSKGPLWIAKQIGLQLSNPKLETSGIGGLFGGPTRIYNLGLNTLAQVPVGAFGIHFDRHGITPIQSENTKYLAVAQANNRSTGAKDNRLVELKNKFNSGLPPAGNFFNTINNLQPIRKYVGGPHSVYGIGQTIIKRVDIGRTPESNDKNNNHKPTLESQFAFKYSKGLGIGNNSISKYFNSIPDENTIKQGIDLNSVDDEVIPNYSTVKTYKLLKQEIDKLKTSSDNVGLFYVSETDGQTASTIIQSGGRAIPNSKNKPIYKVSGDIIDPLTINTSWNEIYREKRIGQERGQDQINDNTSKDNKDFITFSIQPTGRDPLFFRAYITQFSDTTDAKWNSTNYIGRGDEFYIYTGFIRKIQIGFKAAVLSVQELKPMYEKLNYLTSNLMPIYSTRGIMQGPTVKITVGNWIKNQFGILNSLSYTIPENSPWEIALGANTTEYQLPHVVEINLGFTPIGAYKGAVARRGANILALN
jgi:hypothetical protein